MWLARSCAIVWVASIRCIYVTELKTPNLVPITPKMVMQPNTKDKKMAQCSLLWQDLMNKLDILIGSGVPGYQIPIGHRSGCMD